MGGRTVASYGWRALFIGLGFGSLIWIIPWFVWGPRDKAVDVIKRSARPALRRSCPSATPYFFSLVLRQLHLVFPAHVAACLPGAATALHYRTNGAGRLASFLRHRDHLGGCGYLSDNWIARPFSATRIRKMFVVAQPPW